MKSSVGEAGCSRGTEPTHFIFFACIFARFDVSHVSLATDVVFLGAKRPGAEDVWKRCYRVGGGNAQLQMFQVYL